MLCYSSLTVVSCSMPLANSNDLTETEGNYNRLYKKNIVLQRKRKRSAGALSIYMKGLEDIIQRKVQFNKPVSVLFALFLSREEFKLLLKL